MLPSLEAIEREEKLRRLVDFVPALTPTYSRPSHLAPLLERFEAAVRGERQRVCCSAPPRHAKTESVLHVPAFALRRHPELVLAYTTYADRLARSKSRRARSIAEAAGVTLAQTRAVNEWRTAQGGGVLAGGVGGPLTGHGVNLMVVDDPIKNRVEAESGVYREKLLDWFRDVATTRVEPGGSIFVFMTRWHPDDLIGTLTAEGFEYLNLPAIDDAGNALWPGRWPVEELDLRRREVGEYTWASLYQGQPRARGGRVFGDAHVYEARPTSYRSSFGLDLSYAAKVSSDYSVAVKMARAGGKFYVLDCVRRQVSAADWRAECARLGRAEPTASWRWYASGTEQGVATFFREQLTQLKALPPKGDKFVRAIEYAAAWNRGDVLVPRHAPWLDIFVAEHAGFTGVNDRRDDIIDAAVAAFDELSAGPVIVDTELPEAPPPTGLRALAL